MALGVEAKCMVAGKAMEVESPDRPMARQEAHVARARARAMGADMDKLALVVPKAVLSRLSMSGRLQS